MQRITDEMKSAIKELEDKRGRLTPEQVVDAARDKASPLHDLFTWDDSEAAAKWRIEQAREVLKRVKIEVVYHDRTIRTVAYVRDPEKEVADGGYQATLSVTRRGAADLMRAELGQVIALIERARKLAMVKADELPGVADKLSRLAQSAQQIADAL